MPEAIVFDLMPRVGAAWRLLGARGQRRRDEAGFSGTHETTRVLASSIGNLPSLPFMYGAIVPGGAFYHFSFQPEPHEYQAQYGDPSQISILFRDGSGGGNGRHSVAALCAAVRRASPPARSENRDARDAGRG